MRVALYLQTQSTTNFFISLRNEDENTTCYTKGYFYRVEYEDERNKIICHELTLLSHVILTVHILTVNISTTTKKIYT
jgi:hypothetical protein